MSPHNSVGSDIECLLLNQEVALEPLIVKMGPHSPSFIISPSSRSNVTVRRGRDKSKRKKKLALVSDLKDIPSESSFQDIPVSLAIGRVLGALTQTPEVPP